MNNPDVGIGENREETICQKLLENRDIFWAAYRLFHKTFRLTFQDFMDMNLSLITLLPKLDINKFEDWLIQKHEQDMKTMSILEVLKKNYGEDIALQVKGLI